MYRDGTMWIANLHFECLRQNYLESVPPLLIEVLLARQHQQHDNS